MADSFAYREAVSRLRRLLYEDPWTDADWKPKSTAESSQKPDDTRENSLKFIGKKGSFHTAEDEDVTTKILLSMLKRQENLISDLEMRNYSLKGELSNAVETAKDIAHQNESFRENLKATLSKIETDSEATQTDLGDDKPVEVISCLKEEKARLLQMVQLQETNISTLREREAVAMEKIRQAVCLAEDAQRNLSEIREKDEAEINSMKKSMIELNILSKADEVIGDSNALHRLQRTIARLREEKQEKEKEYRKRDIEMQKRVQTLQNSLRDADESKQRIEKLLTEQRSSADEAFKRMDSLLERRNMQLEASNEKVRSVESQLTENRRENQRLIQAINDFARFGLKPPITDDKKLAATQSAEGSSRNTKTDGKGDLEGENVIPFLQKELSNMKQVMNSQAEDLRKSINDLQVSLQQKSEQEDQEQRHCNRRDETSSPANERNNTKLERPSSNTDLNANGTKERIVDAKIKMEQREMDEEMGDRKNEKGELIRKGEEETGSEALNIEEKRKKDEPEVGNTEERGENESKEELESKEETHDMKLPPENKELESEDRRLNDKELEREEKESNDKELECEEKELDDKEGEEETEELIVPLSPETIKIMSEEMNKIQNSLLNQSHRLEKLTENVQNLKGMRSPSPLMETPEEDAFEEEGAQLNSQLLSGT